MSELVARMQRKVQQFSRIGALPEAFIAGPATIGQLDAEADKHREHVYSTSAARGRKHREFLGIPVVFSRTAHPDNLEILVRREGGPLVVEKLR